MANQTQVYNCRTPNEWPSDMALSATHFPVFQLTYAIMYGCTSAIEETMLKKLDGVRAEASHPLLLPGIFAEIELVRHTRLVEKSIVDVETTIFELNFELGATHGPERREVERRNQAKRNIWLDLTYLRNSLITWERQLWKMAMHAEDLVKKVQAPTGPPQSDNMQGEGDDRLVRADETVAVGRRIKKRLDIIRDEYDEKIRDCTMRVDGMAMATQWVGGSTTKLHTVLTGEGAQRDSRRNGASHQS
jgi:hypothetical protein